MRQQGPAAPDPATAFLDPVNFAVQIPSSQLRRKKGEVLSLDGKEHQQALAVPRPQPIHHAAAQAALGIVGEDQRTLWEHLTPRQ